MSTIKIRLSVAFAWWLQPALSILRLYVRLGVPITADEVGSVVRRAMRMRVERIA